MSKSGEAHPPDLLQLLVELDRLQEEQQKLDLRDPRAVEEYEQKIDALRRKIQALPLTTAGRAGAHKRAP